MQNVQQVHSTHSEASALTALPGPSLDNETDVQHVHYVGRLIRCSPPARMVACLCSQDCKLELEVIMAYPMASEELSS